MNAADIIHEVTRHGCNITVQDDTLKLSAPRPLPADLMDELRQHKPEVIAELAPLPHGACFQCGADTRCMLTRPDGTWDWQCISCFDRRAGAMCCRQTEDEAKVELSAYK